MILITINNLQPTSGTISEQRKISIICECVKVCQFHCQILKKNIKLDLLVLRILACTSFIGNIFYLIKYLNPTLIHWKE